MMYFSTLPRAYKCRDFVNMLFYKQGTKHPVVKVEKTIGGFRVVPVKQIEKEKENA